MNWYKKAEKIDWQNEIEYLTNLEEIISLLKQNNIDFKLVKFPTGKQILKIDNKYIVEDFQSPSLNKIDYWISDIGDDDIEDYYHIANFNEDFWKDMNSQFFLYHATDSENYEDIMQNGLLPRNQTRGISNRSTPSSVFTSDNPDDIESYGNIILKIDVLAMKNDGYMPVVGEEEPLAIYEYKSAIAHALGVEYYPEEEPGISPTTIIVYGDIPPKYISRYK